MIACFFITEFTICKAFTNRLEAESQFLDDAWTFILNSLLDCPSHLKPLLWQALDNISRVTGNNRAIDHIYFEARSLAELSTEVPCSKVKATVIHRPTR